MIMIQCLILEDERSAQEVLQSYIEKTPFLNCLGVYESGLDIPLEDLQKVDLLFLDIQLPEINGLSFLKTIQNPPKVIITTAFTNHAIEAFEEAVCDYLVKPFAYERFFKAVTRVRNELHTSMKQNKHVFVYADKATHKIEINTILFLKAEVDYVNIVTKENQILVSDSLRNWKEKLEAYPFMQVHRSYIINLNEVVKIAGNQIYLNDEMIPIGKTYKESFLKKIQES